MGATGEAVAKKPHRETRWFLAKESPAVKRAAPEQPLPCTHTPIPGTFHLPTPLIPAGPRGRAGQSLCCPVGTRVKPGDHKVKGVLSMCKGV